MSTTFFPRSKALTYVSSSEEFFYQLGVRQFGDFHRIKLEPPAPLRTLIKLAVDAEEGTSGSGMSKAKITDVSTTVPMCTKFVIDGVQMIVDRIMSRRPMLREYFHTEISEEGMLETLPLLLKGYTPNLDKLPLFLMRLGPQVCQFSI